MFSWCHQDASIKYPQQTFSRERRIIFISTGLWSRALGLKAKPHPDYSYLVCLGPKHKEVKGYCCNNIYKKPSFKIMHRYFPWMAHNFVIFVHICCPKIYQNINYKHNINNQICYCHWICIATFYVLFPLFTELEGGHVRRKYCRVDH